MCSLNSLRDLDGLGRRLLRGRPQQVEERRRRRRLVRRRHTIGARTLRRRRPLQRRGRPRPRRGPTPRRPLELRPPRFQLDAPLIILAVGALALRAAVDARLEALAVLLEALTFLAVAAGRVGRVLHLRSKRFRVLLEGRADGLISLLRVREVVVAVDAVAALAPAAGREAVAI